MEAVLPCRSRRYLAQSALHLLNERSTHEENAISPRLGYGAYPLTNFGAARKGNGVGLDVSKFDVAGVKLGMSKDEAIAAIKDKFGFQDGDIEYKESDTKNTAELTVKDEVHNIFIRFNRNINESGELGAYWINYTLPSSKENASALNAAAQEKYGEPTQDDGTKMSWCANPIIEKDAKAHIKCDESRGAVLVRQGTIIFLRDSRERDTKAAVQPKL